jgi:hypothetical protein
MLRIMAVAVFGFKKNERAHFLLKPTILLGPGLAAS